jgi:hypothetical protein
MEKKRKIRIKITNMDELENLIGRAYWVESQFELAGQWEAYMEVKDKYRDLLFKIAHDSAEHKSTLKRMFDNMEGLDIERATEGLKGKEFNFKHKNDEEILSELLRNDTLLEDIYSKLYSNVNEEIIKYAWKGDVPEEFYKNLKWLINQERGHIALLTKFTGKLERIL